MKLNVIYLKKSFVLHQNCVLLNISLIIFVIKRGLITLDEINR